MSKRKKRRRYEKSRDTRVSPSRRLTFDDLRIKVRRTDPRRRPSLIETNQVFDGRRWTPPLHEGGSFRFDGRPAEYVLRKTQGRPQRLNDPIGFVTPRKVVVCMRRKERREALFARRKAGKGKRITGNRRWLPSSKVKC